MVDFFEGGLAADAELCHSGFSPQRRDVVNNRLYLIGVEIQPLNLQSGDSLFDLLVGLDDTLLGAF